MKSLCAGGRVVEGIDVSAWNGPIDWRAVRAAGIQFAFIRVSDGLGFPDARFEENWDGAGANGLMRGPYQFFRPLQDPIAQAELVLDAVGRLDPGELPLALDLEEGKDAGDALEPAAIAAAARAWVGRVTAPFIGHGRAPVIYTAPFYYRDAVGGADLGAACPLWVAHWDVACPLVPAPFRRWAFHQYQVGAAGSVPGIETKIDRNRFNGSLPELYMFASGAGLGAIAGAVAAFGAAWLAAQGRCPLR